MSEGVPLLQVRGLGLRLPGEGGLRPVLDGIGLDLDGGDSLGVVGESGAGKSQLALALMGLSPPGAALSGSIRFDGEELIGAPPRRWQALRGRHIGMVFQDPMSALNPYQRILTQLTEAMRWHRVVGSRAAARAEALRLLDAVRMPQAADKLARYPHELSGGQRQRVMLAMALSCRPRLLLADEPTTALDVTVQAGILRLLAELRDTMGLALLLISHDLGVVAQSCARITVLYGGRMMESGPAPSLLGRPRHPYTAALLASRPSLSADPSTPLPAIEGTPPRLGAAMPGCPFAPRCTRADAACTSMPPARAFGAELVACHHPVSS